MCNKNVVGREREEVTIYSIFSDVNIEEQVWKSHLIRDSLSMWQGKPNWKRKYVLSTKSAGGSFFVDNEATIVEITRFRYNCESPFPVGRQRMDDKVTIRHNEWSIWLSDLEKMLNGQSTIPNSLICTCNMHGMHSKWKVTVNDLLEFPNVNGIERYWALNITTTTDSH